MINEEAKIVEVRAFVWNEGEEPQELHWEGPDDFDRLQRELMQHLDAKE